jgi:hypothetical protein
MLLAKNMHGAGPVPLSKNCIKPRRGNQTDRVVI